MKIAVNSMTNAESIMKEGPYVALKHLYELGISCVELSQHIQLDESTLLEYQDACREFHMEVCAISVQFVGTVLQKFPPLKYGNMFLKSYQLEKDREFLTAMCHQFGCRYLRFAGIPGSQLQDREQVMAYMKKLEEVVRQYGTEGIRLCAHNHMEEFIMVEGRTIFDWSLELVPNLFYEIDVRNAQRAGLTPSDLITRCGKRAALLHMQDQKVDLMGDGHQWMLGQETVQDVEIGRGLMNMQSIVNAAKTAGSEYLVIEQNESDNVYESIGISAAALRDMI